MPDPAPTDPPADPPAGPADPPTDPPADPPGDPDDDARVTRANRQAQQYRNDLRDAQTKLDQQGQTLAALAAVFNPESSTNDPAEQLANITTEAESLRNEVTSLRAELLVHNLASDNGGNPNALLDSRAFLSTLTGLDPAADDHAEQVAKAIKAAVVKNRNLAATGQAPARGGASGAGQGSDQGAGSVTQEQFNGMSYAQRAELFRTNQELYTRLAG